MKELQNFVYRHMDALKHHKRYLAMLTALSMLVTFIVPLILVEPADSMTGILVCNKTVHTHNAECYVGDTLVCDIEEHIHTGACYKKISTVSLKGDGNTNGTITEHNVAVPNAGGGLQPDGTYNSGNAHPVDAAGSEYYNPAELPLYTLLFGTGDDHWVDPYKSLEDNLEIVDDEYFLGFASDFCAFIESDFTAFDADAEGRMFVGGDLIFNGIPNGKKWNYQVGAGDYGQFTPILQTDEYGHLEGFASAIIGGKVYRLATMTTGAFTSLSFDDGLPEGRTEARHTDGNDVMLYPEEGAYKRFVIGNLKESLHLDEDSADGEEVDVYYGTMCNHLFYNHDNNCTVCSDKDNAAMDAGEHGYLGKVNELSQFYLYDDVSTILERTFDTLRARSLSLASVQAIEGKIENNTLKLDASDIGDAKTVYFKINNWEGIQRVVITVPDDRITYTKSGDKEEKYSNNNKTIKNLDLNVIVSCGEEEIEITQSIPTYILAKTADEKPDDGYGYKISNRGKDDGGNATNNHPVSSNILYNFYNAEKVTFTGDTNFNGTIFAPNANVTAPETCRGHLSGALIAKSFYGGLEFGYRPYRGGTDIFGMASGYAIPVNKFGDDGETALPGALFAIKQDGKFVSLFESGEGTNFAALPSKVDFSGKTAYEQDEITQDTTASRNYAGNTVIGEKLTAPVKITLYKDSSCNESIESGSTLDNVYTKLYLKANQDVNIDSNENYVVTGPDGNGVYTITLIKPAEEISITARNQGDSTYSDSVKVEFTPQMKLNVTPTDFEVNKQISFNVSEPPAGGDTIYYKYFVNGNYIDSNNNQQDDDYIQNPDSNYTPNAAGDYTFSVKAYVKRDIDGDGNSEYYEIAQATANKVTIKEETLPDDLRIVLSGITLKDGIITSGNDLSVTLETNKELPDGTRVEYAFYNSNYSTNNVFSTQNIVGKDLAVKVKVTLNDKSVELFETVTVDFPAMTLNLLSTNYVVGHSGISFNLNNIPQGAALRCVVDGNSTEYTKGYCNSYEEWYISPKVVRTDIPVDVYVEMNGLTKKFTEYINGTYHENLGMSISQGPYTVGSDITLSLDYAPNGAKVEFKAYDSNNNEVLSTTSDVNNGVATAKFTPNKADKYTFKAFMTYESNPKLEFKIENIDVAAKPVYGELSVNPNVVNTGNKVYLKLYNATSDANVSFEIRNKNDLNTIIATLNGTQGNSGEYTAEYTPSQAGTYNVKAIISKDGATNSYESEFTVNENTSTLDGDLTLDPSDETVKPNTQITINVSNATNGAVLKLNITGPGISEEKTETISDGTYTYSFTAEKVGTYTVTGTLTSGTQTHSLGERKVAVMDEITIETIDGADENGQFKIGEPVTLGLSSLPTGTDHVDYYLLSLDANNVLQNKDELKPSSYNNDDTITFTPGQTGEHEYRANAIDGSGKVIATVTQKFTTIMPQYTIDIIADNEVYTGGEKVTITIDGLPTGNSKFVINNIQCSLDGYGGMTLTKDENTGEYSFTAPDYNLSNEKRNLQITFNYNNGVSLTDTIQIIICEDPEKVVNVTSNENPNIVSLAFKKYLNILEDENTGTDLTDNRIIIDSQDGTFKSVSLVLPSNYNSETASFTIKATFKAANGDTIGEDKTYSKGDVVNGKIDITDIPAYTATIEITPVAGSVTIANCNPTFTKTETRIEQKYAQGFTLNKDEQKEIVLTNWAEDGSTQILDSITFNLNKNGKIYYALIREGETTAPVFKEAKLENNTAKIEGINAEGIEKIKIYTTDESLTINDYTISAFVGSSEYLEDELKAFRTQTQDIINVYTLVEQQAPVGYFKEETVYIVEVKESIKFYETAGESPYPRDVLTTVTVKKTNGEVVLSYAVDVNYNSTNGTKTITMADSDDDPDNNVKFTLTKGENGTLTVDCTDANVDVSKWNTATKPVSNDGYYFDPEAMMVVPVSNVPIEYTDKMGLLFRKIDTMGAAVDGVEIKLYKLINAETKLYEEAGSDMWYWDENSKDHLIDFEKLTIGAVYKIKETYAGGKYELADEIYLKRTDDREVIYWLGSDEMPSDATTENQRTVLDFGANLETRVIRMENTRIPGVKITLKKTDMEDEVLGDEADFAKFCLYAYDGTEILHEIEVKNGQVELDFSNYKGEEKYVSDGYLMPGTYYFKEIKAPDQYEASMKNFYFNVVKTNDGAFHIVASELVPDVLLLEEVQSNGSSNKVIRFRPEALKRVSDGITAETINADTPIIQFKFKTDNGEIGSGNGEGFANAKFTAIINGKEIRYNSSKLPSGCINHNNGNGIFFRNESVTVQFTVRQLCELFNVSVENFNTIKEFVITSWNSTVVEDLEFLDIENPITGGGSSGDSGNTGSGDSGNSGSTMTGGITISEIAWNTNTLPYTVEKLIFYYADGSSKSNDTTIKVNDGTGSWWNQFDLSGYELKNVVAIQMNVSGDEPSDSAQKRLHIKSDGQNIWGKDGDFTYISPNTLYTFGTLPEVTTTTTSATTTTTTTTTTTAAAENTTTEAIPMLSVDRNTIAIPNTPVGNKMNLRVEKRWRGDDGIPELRQPVEVQLMQKKVEGETSTKYELYNPTTDENNQPTGGTVILNEANDWTYIWENLPRFVDDDEAKGKYYYTINEITAVKGYKEPEVSGGDINAGGTVVIINKAKTVDIPAEKIWSNDTEYTPVYPRTVKFKLQVDVDDDPEKEEWKDIPGKTLTITGTGNNKTWSGKFTGLIEGYQYKVVEVDVPYGWTPQYDDATVEVPVNVTESFTGKFKVTNQYAIDEGSIALAKLWEGENAARPYEIYLDLYRSVVAPSYTKTDAPYTDGKLTGNNDPDYKDDYMRLLQHSLYFYDANMCGTDVSTSSDLAWRTNCHTEDEILGGYHDAGDHVMFGLPQGYTASMLSWMYLEFFKGNVTNSEGNVKKNDTYMMNHYEDDHFKVILERFYDFFANSVEYGDNGKIKKLLLQKGQGNIDHLIWCAPEIQKNRENEMIWSETQGSNIAAEYAAALALGYLNFYDSNSADEEEKEKYENYLKIAEDLYEFSGRTTSFIASDSEGTYYKETDEPNPASDDRAWAAAWLYQATKDRDGEENTGYKDARSNSPNQLQWDDVSFSAACAYASQTGNWTNVINKIDSEFINNSDAKKKDFYYIHPWGTARFNAMAQTAVLITAKHLYETPDATHKYSNNTEISYKDLADSYVTWAEGQMDKILGNNTWKDTISTNGCVGGTVEDTNLPICLVTNFVPDGFDVDTPQNPHHRAASGLDSVNGDSNLEYKDSCVYDDDSYTLVGALVGGPAFGAHSDQAQMIGYDHKHPLTDHDYIDDLHDYCCNEVAIDYNAGLVGAAAGLYYFRGTGARSTMIEGVEFGSYGLKTIEDDIASPTKSAIPEVTQNYDVDPANDVAGAFLKTFAMRQTAISINDDSTDNLTEYVVPNSNFVFDQGNNVGKDKSFEGFSIPNVEKISINYTCESDWGTSLSYTTSNGVVDLDWKQAYSYNFSNITINPKATITKISFGGCKYWNDNGLTINSIILYFDGILITADETDIRKGDETKLTIIGNPVIESWNTPEGIEVYQKDGEWYLKGTNAGEFTISATDVNNKTGEVTIRIHDMEISGDDEVEENHSITLEKAYVPGEAATFKWFLNGTVIEGNTDEVQLGEDGTLTFTGKSLGERNFKLEAYDSNGEKITTAEKTIKVYRLETYTHTPDGDTLNEDNVISRTDPDNKYYVSLEQIPTKTRIQSIKVNVNGKLKSNQIVHRTYVGGTTVNDSGKTECNIADSGTITWETLSFSSEMPVGQKNSKYAFEIWYADDATTVEITSVEIAYRKYDDKDLVMSYVDATGNPISEIKQTIRNGESVYFTLAATGGTVDNIVLKNGETTIDNAINEADGKYTVQPQPAGDYTITATMDDYIRTLKFTVKDKITINGSEIMDLNGSQKLSVSNAIEGIQWSVTADENYTVEDGNVVTIKEKDSENIIATFNKSTGDVTTFEYDGEFTLTVNDNYGGEGSTDSITISITERPKLPELPKDIFRELYIKGNSETIKLSAANNWNFKLADLPTHDEKGNPYYYYIQESGYRQTEGGEYKPLTDQTGHFIYSTNASYMPSAYYNNGVAPDKDNAPDIVAKVGNKLHSKMQGQLPSTGGSGVTTYYYLGGVIMLLSIAGFTGLKRRERKRRKE